MPEHYEHTANVIVGKKHTGKSTYLNDIANQVGRRTGKKVLIIDVNGSPAYSEHNELNARQFVTWANAKPGRFANIQRFYLEDKDEMFDLIIEHFKGFKKRGQRALIIFEDCTKYIDANPNKKIKTFLVDHRMWNCDLIFTFHALKRVPPFFWDMTSRITLFKTNDRIAGNERELERRYPNFEAISTAYQKVKSSGDPFINVTIETEV